MAYSVRVKPSALRELEGVSEPMRSRLWRAIESLAEVPYRRFDERAVAGTGEAVLTGPGVWPRACGEHSHVRLRRVSTNGSIPGWSGESRLKSVLRLALRSLMR